MRWIAGISLTLVILLLLGSFLPLIETDVSWVRYWDFPRVQIAFLLIVLGAIYMIASDSDATRIVVAVLTLGALGYHGAKLLPFTEVAPPMVLAAESCPEGAAFRVVSFNMQRDNELGAPFLALMERARPDVILLMETTKELDGMLAVLEDEYPYVVKHVPEDIRFYGMHVLSRLPLRSSRVVFGFETETPSIATGVELPSGEVIRLQGLHPYPPQLFDRGTTLRDAEIYRAAMDAAASGLPSVLAGDLNAVPWETTMDQALRLGGLIEPRVGRSVVPTYGAESLWKSWPLDYVLVQDSFGVRQFGRLPALGSDHHPVLADLCLDPRLADRQVALPARPEDIREAEATFAAAEELR